MVIQGDVPDAIPGGDKIVLNRKLPFANVGVVERDLRMAAPRKLEHPLRNVEPCSIESMLDQEVQDPPAAAAADVSALPRDSRKRGRAYAARCRYAWETARCSSAQQWNRSFLRRPEDSCWLGGGSRRIPLAANVWSGARRSVSALRRPAIAVHDIATICRIVRCRG